MKERITSTIELPAEIDRPKLVTRGRAVSGASRHENPAAYPWHQALTRKLKTDEQKAPAMATPVLDPCEIDAKDTPIHSISKNSLLQAAGRRIQTHQK